MNVFVVSIIDGVLNFILKCVCIFCMLLFVFRINFVIIFFRMFRFGFVSSVVRIFREYFYLFVCVCSVYIVGFCDVFSICFCRYVLLLMIFIVFLRVLILCINCDFVGSSTVGLYGCYVMWLRLSVSSSVDVFVCVFVRVVLYLVCLVLMMMML